MKLQFIISYVLLKVVELLASRNISAKKPSVYNAKLCYQSFFWLLIAHFR